MTLQLPPAIARYFAADQTDGANVAGCFTPDAIVRDEGHTHTGTDAIAQWKNGASAKYQYTAEPFRLEHAEGRVIVTSHLVGNFPGSPIDLRYSFSLSGDKIAGLAIGL